MSGGGFFDERAVIAIAFFVCVGLIVKFFKASFLEFLSNKKHQIISSIENVELKLENLDKKFSHAQSTEKNLLEKNKKLLLSAQKEKEFLISEAEKKSASSLNEAVENKKHLNSKILTEVETNIATVSVLAPIELITQELQNSKDSSLHHEMIDKILDSIIENKSSFSE
jgi:F0F1-type ATP synthase membrane subunit b/b'